MPKTHVLKPNLPEYQILAEVEKYLCGTRHNVSSSTCGHIVYLKIDYVDYKPCKKVRDEIEAIAPNCFVEEINRGYSNEPITSAVFEFDNNREEVYLKMADGSMQRTSLEAIIHSVLQNRTFPKNHSEIAGFDYDVEEKTA